MYLHRVLRIGRRLPQPLPPPQLRQARKLVGAAGLRLPEHLENLLKYGRYVEARRMQETLGFVPEYTTRRTVTANYLRPGREATR